MYPHVCCCDCSHRLYAIYLVAENKKTRYRFLFHLPDGSEMLSHLQVIRESLNAQSYDLFLTHFFGELWVIFFRFKNKDFIQE